MNLDSFSKKPKHPASPVPILGKINELLEPIKNNIEDTNNKYVLNYIQFKSFIKNAIGAPDPLEISKKYMNVHNSSNPNDYRDTPLLKDGRIKNRFQRLHKKIRLNLYNNTNIN